MIVSLLVVTTNVAALDVDEPDGYETAAHEDLHQQLIKRHKIETKNALASP